MVARASGEAGRDGGPGSTLRRLPLLRRVPLGLPILGWPLRRALTFRLLALRLRSVRRRGGGGGLGAGPGGGGGEPAGRTSGLALASGERARKLVRVASSSGRPGRARSACSRFANGSGGGGGCRCTTTSRVVTAAGGRRTSTIAGCPRTLCRSGTIRAVLPTTSACSSRSRGTTITLRFTGRDRTNVSCDTTVTASGAPRLR